MDLVFKATVQCLSIKVNKEVGNEIHFSMHWHFDMDNFESFNIFKYF